MKKRVFSVLLCFTLLLTMSSASVLGAPGPSGQETVTRPDNPATKTVMLENWKIASSSVDVTATLPVIPEGVVDATVAAPGYNTDGWASAEVPASVLGALIDGGYYDAIFNANAPLPAGIEAELVFHANNMGQVPFKDFYMPWWYSTNIDVSQADLGKRATLTFKGISYVGEIYVNGHKLENKNFTIKDPGYLLNSHYAGPGHSSTTNLNILKYDEPMPLNPAPSMISPTVINDTDFEQYKKYFKGTFRTYELDVSEYLVEGANNIKVKVTRPIYNSRNSGDDQGVGDLSYYWVDWDPQPADNNMGLTGESFLTFTGDVRLSNPAVASKVSEALDSATLNFYVDVNNVSASGNATTARISAVVKDKNGNTVTTFFKNGIVVQPNAYCQEVAFDPITIPVTEYDLWWPYMSGPDPTGKRTLYTVEYTMDYFIGTNYIASDNLKHRFGIREVTTELTISDLLAGNATGNITNTSGVTMHQIFVNHRPVLVKGAGYCPTDLLLRHSDRKNEAVVEYIKYMGMNAVRDEGKFFDNKLLDLFDENGIMNYPGWCCCDRFQGFARWSPVERFILLETQYAVVRNQRSHPSFCTWYNGSDRAPSSGTTANEISMEIKMLETLANLRWPSIGSIVGAAGSGRSNVTGVQGGQRMGLGYDYQTPNFFYAPRSDTVKMAGFISEGGGGVTVPVEETVKKMIPTANLWPINTESNYNVWTYFSVRQDFLRMDPFFSLLEHTYGGSKNLTEFSAKAQIAVYDLQRAQYEVLGLRRYTSASGFINWMLCQGWPTMMWNQFDYYLNPNGATFGAAKGNEAVHIMYDTYNYDAYVINNTQKEYNGYTATARIYDLYGNPISDVMTKKLGTIAADGIPDRVPYNANTPIVSRFVGYEKDASGGYQQTNYDFFGSVRTAYGVNKVWDEDDFKLALQKPATPVYFLFMELKDSTGKVVSYNSYALPMKKDVSSSQRSWSRTPNLQAADMTMLGELPAIPLSSAGLDLTAAATTVSGDKTTFSVQVKNNSANIAYGVDLKAYKDLAAKELCAPVIYSDNLFSLQPGETRVIDIRVNSSDWKAGSAISVNCFNNVVSLENPNNVSDSAATASPRRSTPLSSSRNLALATNGASATASSGTASNLISISSTANTYVNTLQDCYLDTDMYTQWSNTAADVAAPWIIVNLGKLTTFDRLVLRTYYINTGGGILEILPFTPGRIVLEGAKESVAADAQWEEIYDSGASYQISSVSTDIVFDKAMTYQLVRIKPSKPRGVTLAYGAVPYSANSIDAPYYGARLVGSGPAQYNAVTTMRLASFEVYAFRKSVYLDIKGNGKVTAGSVDYTRAKDANNRVVAVDTGSDLTLKFAPAKSGADFAVFRDGVDVTSGLDADNQLVLSNVTDDTTITFYDEAIMANRIKSDFKATAVVKGRNANLIVATYDENGRLVDIKTTAADVAANTWSTFSLDVEDILDNAKAKAIKVFLWDSQTFAPILEAYAVE